MSPRAGGEADKLGNRYESAWTIMHLLRVLQGKGESVVVEDVGELADHSEFTYVDSASTQMHQVKRQNDLVNNWTVKSLHGLGIWVSAKAHVAAGRQYHFVSMIPCRLLQELADTARQTDDLAVYLRDLIASNKKLRPVFDELSAPSVLGGPKQAFATLRDTYFHLYGEREINSGNEAIAEVLLEGGNGRSITASLADIIVRSLREPLTRDVLVAKLAEHGMKPIGGSRPPGLQAQVEQVNASWRDSIHRQMFEPVIERPVAAQIANAAKSDEKLILITGLAGGGKSGTMLQVADSLTNDGVSLLGFRLDRLDPFASTSELGTKLGLDRSPVAALAIAAGETPSVLIVDQLDAVSIASGRMPASLDSVVDLVREADGFPQMRVILVCRQFDVENDERIRTLLDSREPHRLSIELLTADEAESAVAATGVDASALTATQRQLLRTPFNLSLWHAIADQANVLHFDGLGRLLDLYWERKRRDARQRRNGLKFDAVVSAMANSISRRETLSVPALMLDDDLSDDADVLVSEGVLTRDGARLAFSHESLFDYAFARGWMREDTTLLDFFDCIGQELFRRGQLRQILSLLRPTDPGRFVDEIESLLRSTAIRFHLKDATLAVLSSLEDPTQPEVNVIVKTAETVNYAERLWRRLSTPAWFEAFDDGGRVAQWLSSGDQRAQEVATNLLARAVSVYPERVAALLKAVGADPSIIRYIVRFAHIHEEGAAFDLLVASLRDGIFDGYEHDLWISVHDLASDNASLAIALLDVYLTDRPSALDISAEGKIRSLDSRDYSVAELVRTSALNEPGQYCAVILPYIVRVAQLTQWQSPGPGYPSDPHFGWRDVDDLHGDRLDSVLLLGAVQAIEHLCANDLQVALPYLEQLEVIASDSAQYILYAGLISAGESCADRSVRLLLESEDRLFCGFRSSSVWMTRRLLQVISAHVTDSQFIALENVVRDLRFSWEGRQSHGWYAFTLLSGLAETRLSELGRRRLGEYRRKFDREQPPEPEGVIGGWFGSPIPPASATYMNDRQWLAAIRKHSSDRHNWTNFTGGARELAGVLQEECSKDPVRFANLSLSFDDQTHHAYSDAILMGFGKAALLEDPQPIFQAVRHIASFRNEENYRWLGWPMRQYLAEVPLDLIELVRDAALTAKDPETDGLVVNDRDDRMGRNSGLELTAMNTARGSLIETLGDVLVYDTDGSRTKLVLPYLGRLVADPIVSVRVSSAHLLAATLGFERAAAVELLATLLATDDKIFTATTVQRLLNYIGNVEPVNIVPLIDRMTSSAQSLVRRVGGTFAAFAAMEWNSRRQLDSILASDDAFARQGVAGMCAHRLKKTGNVEVAQAVIRTLAYDPDESVREEVAETVTALRGEPLRPHAETIEILLKSPSFAATIPQVLFTLERAPDRVDDLVTLCAERFVEVYGEDSADLRTGAAGDASHVGKLVIRALAQARDASERAKLLDVLDALLLVGSYGIDDLVARSERGEGSD